jgi:hypothetical protein
VTGDAALSHRAVVVVGRVKEAVKVVVGCGVFFFFFLLFSAPYNLTNVMHMSIDLPCVVVRWFWAQVSKIPPSLTCLCVREGGPSTESTLRPHEHDAHVN